MDRKPRQPTPYEYSAPVEIWACQDRCRFWRLLNGGHKALVVKYSFANTPQMVLVDVADLRPSRRADLPPMPAWAAGTGNVRETRKG